MIIRVIFTVATLFLLTGCTSEPAESPSPNPTTSSSQPAPTVPPTPELTALNAADFATQIDFFGPGIDFDSADGNVHCGVWDERHGNFAQATGPYVGCRPAEANYVTDPAVWSEVGCRGAEIVGDRPANPVCDSGQAFVGEDPSQHTVGILNPGESIAYAGFTCTSPDPSAVRCVRDADGTGFLVSRDEYRYF